jgi:hypothetical protein
MCEYESRHFVQIDFLPKFKAEAVWDRFRDGASEERPLTIFMGVGLQSASLKSGGRRSKIGSATLDSGHALLKEYLRACLLQL